MTKMYFAEVVADSISPEGHRLTSVKAIYPHSVHKDMLRHRAHNRNVESFRAQPPEKLIDNLRNGGAFKPDVFHQRVSGMGHGQEIHQANTASWLWDMHVKECCHVAEKYLELGIAKQQVNFLLQDLCPLTEIITATDWDNFFALRTELNDDGTPIARPEVYKTAVAIREAIESSTPRKLSYGELHLPMLTDSDFREIYDRKNSGYPNGSFEVDSYWVSVSAGRCARISFGDYKWYEEDRAVSYARAQKLLQSGHMSPFEQQARPFSQDRWDIANELRTQIHQAKQISQVERMEMIRQLSYSGNICGWVPARKNFIGEYDYSLLKSTVYP